MYGGKREGVNVHVALRSEPTGWRRPIGCLMLISHFAQKSPIISGSFAKNDQQLKVSQGLRHPVPALDRFDFCENKRERVSVWLCEREE